MSVFDGIRWQAPAIDWLRAAFVNDRLPHGLIFAGPAGVGKFTAAAALAKLFLCEKPSAAEPCGRCESCRGMAAGTHPDFHVVERKLIRTIKPDSKGRDLAKAVIERFLIDPANMKPVMNRGKVFVIEEAELMNPEAQNALLKTLEEPFGRTLIMLITSMADYLLPTIRSRCQMLRFAPLPAKFVAEDLVSRGVNPADAADAATMTGGSIGLSLTWLETGVVAAARELATLLDNPAGPAASAVADLFNRFVEAYVERVQKRDSEASKDLATREALGTLLTATAGNLSRRLTESNDELQQEKLCRAIDALAQSEKYIDGNVAVMLVIEQLAAALNDALA